MYSERQMLGIGGNLWQRGDRHRVYINHWPDLAGLDIDYYKSGNISGATLDGVDISNGQASRILFAVGKVYWDAATKRIHFKGGGSASSVDVKFLRAGSGREVVDFSERIQSAIRDAVKRFDRESSTSAEEVQG